jgi:hypothetical protein
MKHRAIDLHQVKVFPLSQRESEAELREILINPDATPGDCGPRNAELIRNCSAKIREAKSRKAAVMLIYGAHLIKNGGAAILIRLLEQGWLTHVATNGAGIIHDWEFSFLGRSTESVRKNVATGTFGTWEETGRAINLSVLAGAAEGLGLGESIGRFALEDGVDLPAAGALEKLLRAEPSHPLAAARADLLLAIIAHQLPVGRHTLAHPWKGSCVLAQARRLGIPFTVHPGIGYDIISNHPLFSGAALGRGATTDFRIFGGTVEQLEGGVVLSVGSAIMGPQVFEKSISCVNNLRLQAKRPIVSGHNIYVVDLQDGGNWDWTRGEPPKDNPAYYLRFCKSYARMGGAMNYLQCDNVGFLHHLLRALGT